MNRVTDRLRRLEQRDASDGGMSAAEIEAAAAEFEQKIVAMPAGQHGIDHDEARAVWRALVEAPGPRWLQRVFADGYPGDLYL